MMHLKDDQLRAFLDREVSGEQAASIQEHLDACPTCKNRLDLITWRAQMVRARLDSLAPGSLEQPRPTQAAYKRFTHNTQPFSKSFGLRR